jgi:Flp pilus assembly protein TadD
LFFVSCSTKTVQSEFDFANTIAKNELWTEALIRWEKLKPKMKNSAKLHNNLAIAYEQLGEFDKAKTEYKRALELAPKNDYIKSNYEHFIKTRKDEKNEKSKKNKK